MNGLKGKSALLEDYLALDLFACMFMHFPNRSEISIRFCVLKTHFVFVFKIFFRGPTVFVLFENFGAKLAHYRAKY